MPVILPLVLQSVWPACLPFRPPQGLAGRPWAPGRWPPFWSPELRSSSSPCSLQPSSLSCPFCCASVHSCLPHRPLCACSRLVLVFAELPPVWHQNTSPSCLLGVYPLDFFTKIFNTIALWFLLAHMPYPQPIALNLVEVVPASEPSLCLRWPVR